MAEPIDFLVETPNPDALDTTLQQIGAVLIGGGTPQRYLQIGDYYVMRVLGDPGFVKFACETQGYCRIVGPAVSDD